MGVHHLHHRRIVRQHEMNFVNVLSSTKDERNRNRVALTEKDVGRAHGKHASRRRLGRSWSRQSRREE